MEQTLGSFRSQVVTLRLFLTGLCLVQLVVSDEPTFRSTSNLVLVDVMALDPSSGRAQKQLTRDDFEILDNGRPVSIRTFDVGSQSRPLVLWFLLQCNMQGWDREGSALFSGRSNLLAPALRKLNERDRLAVAHWCDNGRAEIDLLPTSDTQHALSALDRTLGTVEQIGSHGRSGELALQKALSSIIETTRTLPGKPIPAIVFLYGDWSAMPKGEANRFVDELLSTTAIVFGIKDLQSPQMMKGLSWIGGEQPAVANYFAVQTGGQYLRAAPNEYAARLACILDELHGRYELGFQPEQLDGKRHSLRVRLIAGGRPELGRIRLRYRTGYVSSPVSNQ